MQTKKSVVFLLGSGTSIPAGFPSTTNITDQILSGDGVIRHTDSRYYLRQDPSPLETYETERYLTQIISLIEIIKQLMESYDKEETLNYEIIYYFIQQLYEYESGDLLNMALYPFIQKVKNRLNQSIQPEPRYIDLFREAENYIRHTVWGKLSIQPTKYEHLSFLSDAIKDPDIDVVNVGTLNHDLLIETHLEQNGIAFNDGFGNAINGVRYWENKFGTTDNILKLHGSINWFNLSPDDGDWFDDKIGIVVNNDIDHAKSLTGSMMRSLPEKEPRILIGTFNKIYEYSDNIFSDIFYLFRDSLKKSQSLIISGYSFGDKGINNAILDWLYTDRENRITVIHRNPDDLLINRARSAFRKAYSGVAKNNFLFIPKSIEDTNWAEIKTKIQNP